jgi:nuclear pore complex protein Nup155
MATVVDSMQQAAKRVGQLIARDEVTSDLEQLGEEVNYNNIFFKKQFAVLPEPLFEQYSKLEYKCFMGLFPEIHRAWVTIDNKFYVWSYLDGSDFNEYDELDQVIICAGLVKPKKGIFKDYVKHLLVLATPAEIVLVAITFNGDKLEEMNMLPTNYSVSSDGVNIIQIQGSNEGRIFMCGKDGCLYELDYEQKDGWFQRKCQKRNHSQSAFGLLLPNIFKFGSETPIIGLVVDNTRKILYTLSENSVIQVYDLGEDGRSAKRVDIYNTLYRDAARLYPRLYTQYDYYLIGIVPTLNIESRSIHLIAITNKGDRFFFCTNEGSNISRPKKLEFKFARPIHHGNVLQSRLSPQRQIVGGSVQLPPVKEIHEVFYSRGVFILADTRSEDSDALFTINAEQTLTARGQTGLTETIGLLDVQGRTYAVAEVPLQIEPAIIPPNASELVTQHIKPPREFICLSNNGIQLINKLRPVDRLERLISEDGENEVEIKRFFELYGPDEACAMCVMLLCQAPYSTIELTQVEHQAPVQGAGRRIGQSPAIQSTPSTAISFAPPSGIQPRDVIIARSAEDLLLKYGGEPRYETSQRNFLSPVNAPQQYYEMGGPSLTPEIKYSHFHNGLYIYFARLIRPMWAAPIVDCKTCAKDEDGFKANDIRIIGTKFSYSDINQVHTALLALKDFFTRHKHLFKIPSNVSTETKQNIMKRLYGDKSSNIRGITDLKHEYEAQRMQQVSLGALYILVDRSIQVLIFLSVLAKYKQLEKLPASCPQEHITTICRKLFKDFVVEPDAVEIMKGLMKLIIAANSQDKLMEQIIETLSTQCPDYFGEYDLRDMKAYDNLVRAGSYGSKSTEGEQLIEQALNIYREIADKIPNIAAVTAKFVSLNAQDKAVELALSAAEKIDEDNLAEEYIKNQEIQRRGDQRTTHDSLGQKLYNMRMECYRAALSVLETLTPPPPELEGVRTGVLKRMRSSEDRLFHEQMYDWFIKHGRHEELLALQPPYLEQYLITKNKDLEILYKFYASTNPTYAAKTLVQIAQTDSRLTLEQRISNLSKAIGHAKTVKNDALLNELMNDLEVATVQQELLAELQDSLQDETGDRKQRVEAIDAIHKRLLSLTEMYNDYAVKFHLQESKLLILHCADHRDELLIRKTWFLVIQKYVPPKGVTPIQLEERFNRLRSNICKFSKMVGSIFFPVDYVCALLEYYNTQVEKVLAHPDRRKGQIGDDSVIIDEYRPIELLLACSVSYEMLYDAYRRVFEATFKPYDAKETILHTSRGTRDEFNVTDFANLIPKSTEVSARLRILNNTVHALLQWIKRVDSLEASYADRQSFTARVRNLLNDLAEYEQELNKYADDRVDKIKKKCREAKNILIPK